VQVSLTDINNFAKCPAYFNFKRRSLSPPIHIVRKTIMAIIKGSYTYTLKTNKKVPWRTIVELVDTKVFKNVDITDKEAFQATRKLAEYVLHGLQRWYTQYQNDIHEVYVNVPVIMELSHVIITDTIDLIHIANPVRFVTFSDTSLTRQEMYNSLIVRGKRIMITNSLYSDKMQVQNFAISNHGVFTTSNLMFRHASDKIIKSHIAQLAASIREGINYTSRTAMCNTCTFQEICNA